MTWLRQLVPCDHRLALILPNSVAGTLTSLFLLQHVNLSLISEPHICSFFYLHHPYPGLWVTPFQYSVLFGYMQDRLKGVFPVSQSKIAPSPPFPLIHSYPLRFLNHKLSLDYLISYLLSVFFAEL